MGQSNYYVSLCVWAGVTCDVHNLNLLFLLLCVPSFDAVTASIRISREGGPFCHGTTPWPDALGLALFLPSPGLLLVGPGRADAESSKRDEEAKLSRAPHRDDRSSNKESGHRRRR